MSVRGVKTVRRVAQWLHSRTTNFVLILGYHRVARTAVDPYTLCVQPGHFTEHLDVLRRTTNVIDLKTLHQGLLSGRLPRRAVMITFDDGYHDILQTAQPLLAARNLPATAFVVTGILGQELWWDRLARLLFSPVTLPDNLAIEIGRETITWSMMDSLQKAVPDPRHRLLYYLYQRLTKLPEERPFILAQLQRWVETAAPLPAATARTMTAAELQSLNNQGLISIGSHTVTHPLLTTISQKQQCAELTHSRQALENILGQPVTAFSYPHGANDATTQELVQKAGFQLACSSQNGIVHKGQNRFALPRFWAPDWNGEQFGRWLTTWL